MIGTRFVRGSSGVVAAVTLAAAVSVALPVRGLAAPARAAVSAGRWLTGRDSIFTKVVRMGGEYGLYHFFELG